MNNRLISAVVFAFTVATKAMGQTPTPPPDEPTPPFVARAPEFSAWVVEVVAKKTPAPTPTPVPVSGANSPPVIPTPPPKVLRTSTVTKTRDVLRDDRTYTDGTKSELWWIHGRILREDPQRGYINIVDPNIDRAAPQFNMSDFETVGWVAREYFSRVQTKGGQECYLYEWKERMPTAAEFEKLGDYGAKSAMYYKFRGKPVVPTQAWVSKETKLPVASEDENTSFTYRFLKPPTEMLVLPPAFQKEWDKYDAVLNDWKKRVMPKQG